MTQWKNKSKWSPDIHHTEAIVDNNGVLSSNKSRVNEVLRSNSSLTYHKKNAEWECIYTKWMSKEIPEYRWLTPKQVVMKIEEALKWDR